MVRPHVFAARIAVGTLVAVVATLWLGRLVVTLLFLAIIIASAIRPGVEALKRKRVPRGVGVLLHYAVLLGVVAEALWLVVPAALDQVQSALGPEHGLRQEAQGSTGIKRDLLLSLDRRLQDLPSGSKIIDPALEYGRTAFEAVIGTFFVFATAAYWTLQPISR
jgi:predicted PurR-regulated permease PerM